MRDVGRVWEPAPCPFHFVGHGARSPHDKWSIDLPQNRATYPFRDRLWLG